MNTIIKCNPLHYKVLESDPTTEHLGLVEQWCSKWLQRREISPQMASWIVNRKAKPGVAFGNIKTHKKDNPLDSLLPAVERLLKTFQPSLNSIYNH